MKPLTATFAAVVLALMSMIFAGTANANEWKMGALSRQVTILPEALGLQNTDRREFICLALAIYHEARGEKTRTGREAVAHVVYNRTGSRAFPDSICGVVWDKGQFGWTTRPVGSLYPREPAAWLDSQRVAIAVLKGGRDPTNGATYFYGVNERKPTWAYKAIRTWRHGNHVFVSLPGTLRQQAKVRFDKVVEIVAVTAATEIIKPVPPSIAQLD